MSNLSLRSKSEKKGIKQQVSFPCAYSLKVGLKINIKNAGY